MVSIRFTNGFWRVLDMVNYVELASFGRLVDAQEAVKRETGA